MRLVSWTPTQGTPASCARCSIAESFADPTPSMTSTVAITQRTSRLSSRIGFKPWAVTHCRSFAHWVTSRSCRVTDEQNQTGSSGPCHLYPGNSSHGEVPFDEQAPRRSRGMGMPPTHTSSLMACVNRNQAPCWSARLVVESTDDHQATRSSRGSSRSSFSRAAEPNRTASGIAPSPHITTIPMTHHMPSSMPINIRTVCFFAKTRLTT